MARETLLIKLVEAAKFESSENEYLSEQDSQFLTNVSPYMFMATMTDFEVDNWLSQLEDDDYSIKVRMCDGPTLDFTFVVRT